MQRGHLRIGSYGPYDVIKLVARYSVRFPSVSIFVDFSPTPQSLAEKLISYELDVRASIGRIETEARILFASVQRSAARRHRATKACAMLMDRSSVRVAEFGGQTVVCREPGSAARAAHDRLLRNGRVSPGRMIEFASREGVVNAVAEGIGIATIFDEGILPGDRVTKLKIVGVAIQSRVEIVVPCRPEIKIAN